MALKEGDKVPSVTFKARVRDENLPQPNPFTWKDVASEDLFRGKRSVLFALPGGKYAKKIIPYLFVDLKPIFLHHSFHPNVFFHSFTWI